MKTVNVALLGFGIVGRGTYEAISKGSKLIEKRYGVKVKVKKILEINDAIIKASGLPKKLFTPDYNEILNDDSIQIVAEMMGGRQPATSFMLAALNAGKNVVSSNKMALAESLPKLKAAAKKNNVKLYYEASVCGAIPVITSIRDSLGVNGFREIRGIVNGTSNFILTHMIEGDMAYSDALALAQKLGFAEKDPTDDVEGIDSANKLSLLTELCTGIYVAPSEIKRTGITGITLKKLAQAKAEGKKIKLVATARATKDGVKLSVKPELVSPDDLLYNVDYVFNGIILSCEYADDIFLYGRGAGSLPTGSAVAGDIINIAKEI
ncbi:MAG: homoserine dehydrogenase [Firmicutes bacterium]|nr:homoserine dehydrogenase [Bacillota bacterium]